ncbi:hypothetical protein Tsubulata_016807 [Turnera subulata]|uniref:F-box domain-containing protein n=1 Tax=Turnera subulata TaxID=218843 RepID=A0A9Q0F6K5_9ROSI|nr:hypothetical protein Tsubulata_016807 [Turnera subulata]
MAMPQDLVEDILSVLPANSLVRFTSVCKSWRRLIRDDPAFKALQASKAAASPATRCSYLFKTWTWDSSPGTRRRFSMLYNGTPVTVGKPVFNPFAVVVGGARERRMFVMLGSHDGIVCILVYSDCNHASAQNPYIYLWNPSINKVKPLQRFWCSRLYDLFGFGFSKQNKEYRIVSLIDDYFNLHRRAAYVYSSKADSWNQIDMVSSGWNRIEFRCITMQPTILDGAPHWLAVDRTQNLQFSSEAKSIISFDFDTERFGCIALPAAAVGRGGNHHYSKVLGTFKGSLAFVNCSQHNRRSMLTGHDVWVLREYGVESSWIKLFSLEPTLAKAVSFGISGELFLLPFDDERKELIEVSDKGKITRTLQLKDMIDSPLLPYTESLVLLDYVPRTRRRGN